MEGQALALTGHHNEVNRTEFWSHVEGKQALYTYRIAMFINHNPLVVIKVFAIIVVPPVIIWWLLPKFLNSNRSVKILSSAVIVSIYTVTTVSLVDGSGLQIQNIKFVATITSLIWGIIGFVVGAYFDLRLRFRLGPKYHQEFLRLRLYGVEYGIVGAIISLPLGITAGWLVVVFGASSLGLLLSAALGAVFGAFFGRVLNWQSMSSKI